MRFLRQSFLGVLLAAVALGLVAYAGHMVRSAIETRMADDRRPPPARERVFAVRVVTAEAGTEQPILTAFGQVESRRTLEIRSAMGGRVLWLSEHFEDGGAVRAGDILVRIDPADAQAAFDRAESDVLDAQAEGRDASRSLVLAADELEAAEEQERLQRQAFQRQQDLESRGVGTAAAVEAAEMAAASARQAVLSRRQAIAQAETRLDQAATRLRRAEIARDEAQRDLDEAVLTARFDGTLSNVALVEGRLVSANEKLADLIDPGALEVAFRVSTSQYARLLDAEGRLLPAEVRVSLDVAGADLVATGRLSRDSAASGAGQTGRLLFARLDAAPGFKPGDFVTVEVDEPPVTEVTRLPASALDARGTVLVLGPEDRLETLEVELVRRQGDDVLVRGTGLEGREVVVGRTPLLGAGIRVRPLRDAPETAPETASGPAPGPAPEQTAMLELSAERRARLVAFVEGNAGMPAEMKAQVLSQLGAVQVPAGLVERLESRIGG